MIITINQCEVHAPELTEPLTLTVLSGTLWLTDEGEPGDQVLTGGSLRNLQAGQKVVLQSLEGSASYEFLPRRGRLGGPSSSRVTTSSRRKKVG